MGLATSFLKKNKQQNVIFTQLILRYLGEVAMILKGSSCSVHLLICMQATLSNKKYLKVWYENKHKQWTLALKSSRKAKGWHNKY